MRTPFFVAQSPNTHNYIILIMWIQPPLSFVSMFSILQHGPAILMLNKTPFKTMHHTENTTQAAPNIKHIGTGNEREAV